MSDSGLCILQYYTTIAEMETLKNSILIELGVNCTHYRSNYRKKYETVLKHIINGEHKSLCMFCLKQGSNCETTNDSYEIYTDLFTSSKSIAEIVRCVFGTKVWGAGLTSKVCDDCLKQLLNSYMFLNRCKINQFISELCIQKLLQVIPTKHHTNSIKQRADNKLCLNLDLSLNSNPFVNNQKYNRDFSNTVTGKKKDNRNKLIDPQESNIKECSMCARDFKDEKDLFAHQNIHPPGTTHICRRDGHIFSTSSDLKRHVRRCHGQMEKCVCPVCGKLLPSTASLNRHLTVHGNNKFVCPKCSKTFSSNMLLKRHSKTHNMDDKTAVCDKCGKICKSAELLKAHSNSHRTKECPYCKKILKTHAHFKYHIRNHETGVGRKLQYHTTYKCSDCNYESQNKNSLEAHINKVHLNVRPFGCGVCGKCFYRQSNLVEHELTHLKNKLEHCKYCSKTFRSQKCLNTHLRLHSGYLPFPCDLCDRAFVTAGRRLDHKRRKHSEKSERCLRCDKKYSLKRDLTRHINKVHKGLTPAN